jgi:hypothetical protein
LHARRAGAGAPSARDVVILLGKIVMQQEKLLVNTVHLKDIDEQAGMLPDWTQK